MRALSLLLVQPPASQRGPPSSSRLINESISTVRGSAMGMSARILNAVILHALLLPALVAHASDDRGRTDALIREAAVAANIDAHAPHGVFTGTMSMLHLAPDGRYTRQFVGGCGLSGPAAVSIGRYWRAGDSLILEAATVRVEWEYDPIISDYRSHERLLLADESEAAQLLLVPLQAGLHLLDADQLAEAANMINYNGELPAWLMYSRRVDTPGSDDSPYRRQKLSSVDIASFPDALRMLLRDGPVDAHVTHLINAHALEWKAHEAELRIGLDRGERDGLYLGMSMRAPGSDFQGTIETLHANSAVLRIEVERFHPHEIPAFPTPGLHFSSAREDEDEDEDEDSHDDPEAQEHVGIALKGSITWLSAAEGLDWDDDDFAFVDAMVDIGADDGLQTGDTLFAEAKDLYAQARVLAVEANQAHVLIRIRRYRFTDEVIPAIGDTLTTPAWQAARWNMPGDGAEDAKD
jgi:hypothetical protein